MRRWTAAALLAVAFLLGLVVGGLGHELLHLRRISAWHHGGARPPELGFLVRRLERRLDLSPEQVRRVEEIVERTGRDFQELHREIAPRVHRRLEETRAEIEEVLTPAQREELRRLGPALLPERPHPPGSRRHPHARRGPPGD